MWIELAKHQSDNAYAVAWERNGRKHRVVYGLQTKEFSGIDADMRAAYEFGACVRHAAECNGLLD